MLNFAKKLWKRSERVILRKPSGHGVAYWQLMDRLKELEEQSESRDIIIDSRDLLVLLHVHALIEIDRELDGVRTAEGRTPRFVSTWGEEKDLGMLEWLEAVPVPGLNMSCIYRFSRSVRTGQ